MSDILMACVECGAVFKKLRIEYHYQIDLSYGFYACPVCKTRKRISEDLFEEVKL